MRRPRGRPYAWLPALITGMTVVALMIGGVALHYVETNLVASTGESLALAAADIADKLDRILYERYGDIQMLARAPVIQGRDHAAKSTYLIAMKATYRYYLWLGVTDAKGRIVAASDPESIGKDRSGEPWFTVVRDRGGIDVQDVQAFEETGEVLAVAYTAPVTGSRGEFLGTVTTRVGLPVLEDVIAGTVRALQIQRGAMMKIEYQFLTRDGDIIADSILREEGKVNLKYLALPSALLSASAKPGYVEETHLRRHVPVVTGYAGTEGYGKFTGLHWAVLVRMDRSDALAPIQSVLWKVGVAGAVVFVPMLLVLVWAAGKLRKEWLQAQEETTRATAAEAAMRESERRYRHLVDHANDIIYQTDAEGRFVLFNPTAVRLLKYSEEELLGRSYLDLIHPDYRKTAERFYGRQFVRRTPSTYFEVPILAKDGSEIWIGQNVQRIIENGLVTGFQSVARDITDRKRAEEALRTTNAALRQALQEVKVLRGFIPICMSCKKIRDDGGYWQQLESYIHDHSEAQFSHGVCPDCLQKLYPEYSLGNEKTDNR